MGTGAPLVLGCEVLIIGLIAIIVVIIIISIDVLFSVVFDVGSSLCLCWVAEIVALVVGSRNTGVINIRSAYRKFFFLLYIVV